MSLFCRLMSMSVILYASSSHCQSSNIDVVRVWAENAQQQCFMKIHFDTFAYQDCLVMLANDHSGNKPIELGIYYFGYVGAMDSVRTGMYGSKNTAWYFLNKFQKIQRSLLIDDKLLCTTVPGNCDIRISQIVEMAKSPAPKSVDIYGSDSGAIHRH